MRVPSWVLKSSVTMFTVLATVGSAGFVNGHLKNPAAPLHPTVQRPLTSGSAAQSGQTSGSGLDVPTTSMAPVTSTYAS